MVCHRRSGVLDSHFYSTMQKEIRLESTRNQDPDVINMSGTTLDIGRSGSMGGENIMLLGPRVPGLHLGPHPCLGLLNHQTFLGSQQRPCRSKQQSISSSRSGETPADFLSLAISRQVVSAGTTTS